MEAAPTSTGEPLPLFREGNNFTPSHALSRQLSIGVLYSFSNKLSFCFDKWIYSPRELTKSLSPFRGSPMVTRIPGYRGYRAARGLCDSVIVRGNLIYWFYLIEKTKEKCNWHCQNDVVEYWTWKYIFPSTKYSLCNLFCNSEMGCLRWISISKGSVLVLVIF